MVRKFTRLMILSAAGFATVFMAIATASVASADICNDLFVNVSDAAFHKDQLGVLTFDMKTGRTLLSYGYLQGSMVENGKTYLTLLASESSGLHTYESSLLFRATEPQRAYAKVIDMNKPNPVMESRIVTLVAKRTVQDRQGRPQDEYIARRADGKLVQVWYFELLDAPADVQSGVTP